MGLQNNQSRTTLPRQVSSVIAVPPKPNETAWACSSDCDFQHSEFDVVVEHEHSCDSQVLLVCMFEVPVGPCAMRSECLYAGLAGWLAYWYF